MRDVWSTTPICFIPVTPLPGCPYCGSRERVFIRSVAYGDGAREQRFVCRVCSTRYRIGVDPTLPTNGNETL